MDDASDKKPLLSEMNEESKKDEPKKVVDRVERPEQLTRPFSTRDKGFYWILSLLHLLLLLSVLGAMCFGLMQWVFYQTKDGPMFFGQGSFVGGVPAIYAEPYVAATDDEDKGHRAKIIKFNPESDATWKPYTKRLSDRLENVLTYQGTLDCTGNTTREEHWDGRRTKEYCVPLLSHMKPMNDSVCSLIHADSSSFGYANATPCILLRLTKILGYFPQSDEQEANDGKLPEDHVNPCEMMLEFDCSAKSDSGEDVALLMAEGIPYCSFPFWNQENYLQPFVFFRPVDPLPIGKTTITCRPKLKTLRKLSDGRENEEKIIIRITDK